MQTFLRRRPSPAMVVACLALLVALGGTSVAAVQALGPNTVGTAQLKANAVTTAKVKNNAITGTKVLNGSLTKRDFAAGSLPAGATGPAGPAGPAGSAGPAGPAGTVGPITVRQASVVVPGGTAQNAAYVTGSVTVNCVADEKAISAGTGWSDDDSNLELTVSRITPLLTNGSVLGYRASGGNDSGQSSTFTLYVSCYKA